MRKLLFEVSSSNSGAATSAMPADGMLSVDDFVGACALVHRRDLGGLGPLLPGAPSFAFAEVHRRSRELAAGGGAPLAARMPVAELVAELSRLQAELVWLPRLIPQLPAVAKFPGARQAMVARIQVCH